MSEGVFRKYRIEKFDGGICRPCDPEACYFVLRLDTDPAARKAMRAYATHCGDPKLAGDIRACLDELEKPPCGCREANCPHLPVIDPVWRYGS